MNRLTFYLAVVGLASLPALVVWGATSGTWQKACQSGTTFVTTSVQPGSFVCWDPVLNNDSSPILYTGQCENFDVFQFLDKDGDGTAWDGAGTIETCPDSGDTIDDDTKKDAGCDTQPSTVAMTGLDAEYGLAGIWTRITLPNTGSNPGDARFIVKCAQGPS